MVHTAIIAFILILIMLFLSNTGEKKHQEEVTKGNIEINHEPKDVTEEHPLLKESGKNIEAKAKEEVNKATAETKVKEEAKEATAEAKVAKEKSEAEEEKVAKEKSEVAKEKATAEAKAKEEADKEEISILRSTTTTPVSINDGAEVNITIPSVPSVPTVSHTTIKQDVDKASLPNASTNVVNVLDKEIVIPSIPNIPTVPSVQLNTVDLPKMSLLKPQTELERKQMEEFKANSQVLDKLHHEQKLKEEAIAYNRELKRDLEREEDEERALKRQLEKVRLMAENGEVEARKYEERNKQEIQSLLGEKKELTSELSSALEDKKELKAKTVDLDGRIAKLLAIAKDASGKIKVEYDKDQEKLQKLLEEKKRLERDFNNQANSNEELKAKTVDLEGRIAKLLAIAKDATVKIKAEYDKDQEKLKALLVEKETIEKNFIKQGSEKKVLESNNIALEDRIVTLLTTAKESTLKAQASASEKAQELGVLLKEKSQLSAIKINLEAKIEELLEIARKGTKKAEFEFVSLLSAKETLENNLTVYGQNKKELEVENFKIATLLSTAGDENVKSKNEIELQRKELNILMGQKNKLLDEKSILQGKIDKLLDIAQKGTQKAQLAFNSLMSQEKSLKTENINLKATIEEIKELNKANAEIERLKEEKHILEENMKKAAAEAQAKEEAEKAAAEAQAKEEAEKAAAEAQAKEEAEKAAAETKAKEEAEKAAAETKVKEEAEKAAAETKVKEEAEKAAAEAKAKEEGEKAAAETKAKEEAAKAAVETKAKEEAEKAAAEAKAKEEAEKAAAEAKEAEVKLMDAFSLTKVAFQTGSMRLTSASQKRLDVAVDTMKQYEGYFYKIQGHTDSRGKEAFNLLLSTKRAEAVKSYLISKGIDENVLSAEGMGSSQPISSNDIKKGREENRRVVFEITQ